ncbi:MAG: right-handed parallel beta-helix repeat-containing protein, partial [Candidatus Thorarchaeota archaeon]
KGCDIDGTTGNEIAGAIVSSNSGSLVEILDCTFSSHVIGPNINGCDTIIISSNTFSDFSFDGLRLTYSSGNITDNLISNMGRNGISVQGGVCDIRNNVISNVDKFGFTVAECETEFTGNTLNGKIVKLLVEEEDQILGSDCSEIILQQCSNITVDDLSGNSSVIAQDCQDLTIQNCAFENGGLLLENCEVNVINSSFDIQFGKSIEVNYGRCRISSCIIDGNELCNSAISSTSLEELIVTDCFMHYFISDAIFARSCERVIVENNTISYSKYSGITINSCQNIQLLSNSISQIGNRTRGGWTVGRTWGPGNDGIYVENSDNCSIRQNHISNTFTSGIYLALSTNSSISDNTIKNTLARGVVVRECVNTVIQSNYLENIHWYGIAVYKSMGTRILDNNVQNMNGLGYYWTQIFSNARIDQFENNTISDEDVLYFQNQNNLLLEDESGEIILINCSYAEIKGFRGNGILAYSSEWIWIHDSEINRGGIDISNCSHAIVGGCEVQGTPYVNETYPSPIGLEYEYTLIYLVGWGLPCINLYDSPNSTLTGNSIRSAGKGFISIERSNAVSIIANTLNNSQEQGIVFDDSDNFRLVGNSINHTTDIMLSLNRIQGANIFGNGFGSSDSGSVSCVSSSNIVWNNNSLGNYWQEYSGVDANDDGIGENPHIIDSENSDFYPLADYAQIVSIRTEIYASYPIINNVTISPLNPNEHEIITFEVSAEAICGVARVILSYSSDDGVSWSNITMEFSNVRWFASIEENPPETEILCKVYVLDGLGSSSVFEIDQIRIESSFGPILIAGIAVIGIITISSVIYIIWRSRQIILID